MYYYIYMYIYMDIFEIVLTPSTHFASGGKIQWVDAFFNAKIAKT